MLLEQQQATLLNFHPHAHALVLAGILKDGKFYQPLKISSEVIAEIFRARLLAVLLAYVFIDSQNFNIELVRKGFSPYYTKYGRSEKYDEEFKAAEAYAVSNGLVIWTKFTPLLAK